MTVLRFGDDVNGMAPAEEAELYARMRLGNGTAGNIGAEAISQVYAPAFLDPSSGASLLVNTADIIEKVTNPLPALGGTAAETMEEVRQYAPQAFRTQRRCVTPEDYADRASQHTGVQRAAATLRWTGSWHTTFLTVDRKGGLPVDADFEEEIRDYLEPWRMAGHDLEIDAPRYVSLEVLLMVCVQPGYFRSDVKRALLDVFSSRRRTDGTAGYFHADRFTFGDSVYLSSILAAAQSVDGVQHVEVTALRRQGETTVAVPDVLTTDRLEIPRLENNPSFPDHGIIGFDMKGGR
jgi:predicted phage baseplate assembly protein